MVLCAVEALHLGTLMAAHGYFFPISDHVLTLKDDGTFYRFQVCDSACTLKIQTKLIHSPNYTVFIKPDYKRLVERCTTALSVTVC